MSRHLCSRGVYILAVLILLFSLGFAERAFAAVNINTASSAELETLDGIGPAKAGAIIEYRETNGLFETIDELKDVSGIGDVTFENVRSQITVSATGGSMQTGTDSENQSSAERSTSPVGRVPPPSAQAKVSIGDGRDKMGIVGMPIEFIASAGGTSVRGNTFRWNFGDGTTARGAKATHEYEYPGEYVVILNAPISSGDVSVRINVSITEPELLITSATSERIELTNNSNREASMYGRALVAGENVFIFPEGTFIRAGGSVSFGSKVTGLENAHPYNTSIIVLGRDLGPASVTAKLDEMRQAEIRDMKTQILALEARKLALARSARSVSPEEDAPSEPSEDVVVEEEAPLVAAAAESVNSNSQDESQSWWDALKSFFLWKRE